MALLAHQGGWDEALFVAVPMLGIIGLLWLARHRADRMTAQRLADTSAEADADSVADRERPAH